MDNIAKHNKMMDLYKSNNGVEDWILKFYSVRRPGVVRTRAFQDKTRRIYYRYGWALQENLAGLTKGNFLQQINNAKVALFFYEYLFNKKVLAFDATKDKHNDNIVGTTMTFEIDVPFKGAGVDLFSNRYWDDFNYQKYVIEKELEKGGEEWNCIFSGNGAYIVSQSRYMDEEDINGLQELRDIRKTIIEKLSLVSSGRWGRPVIDSRDLGWANYFKAPFTYHETRDRFTFPIKKGNIDRKWLQDMCDINNICGDDTDSKGKIAEILRECKWKSIW